MERQITKTQVPFDRLCRDLTWGGFFLAMMLQEQIQRLIVLAAAQLIVFEIHSLTRFQWLREQIEQFLSVI
ncbi:hypothetical protein [Holdemania massiliensis]|uniref:hypothetical protein n=1 Tax=Holdemania massiliensis TaxID=1468449 RepID=UPI001F058599|nr:hypothetical protein [Holdemania massiliensis]MCH1941947.1 hypothetical protein [Holdemania massiliensis]